MGHIEYFNRGTRVLLFLSNFEGSHFNIWSSLSNSTKFPRNPFNLNEPGCGDELDVVEEDGAVVGAPCGRELQAGADVPQLRAGQVLGRRDGEPEPDSSYISRRVGLTPKPGTRIYCSLVLPISKRILIIFRISFPDF